MTPLWSIKKKAVLDKLIHLFTKNIFGLISSYKIIFDLFKKKERQPTGFILKPQ